MTLLVHYRENLRTDNEVHSWKWVQVVPCTAKDGVLTTKYVVITEAKADKIKEKEGLVCVASDNAMQIWDTPDKDFQRKYKGKIKITEL